MEHFRHALTVFAVAALLAPARGAHAGRPVFHHHRADHEGEDQDHTRNRSAKPAKASVPGLTLHSRSLLGKDGKTEVEISTAPFDIGATPPGNISGCDIRADVNQLKFYKRYEHLREGGYVHWTYTGLPHAQALRIRAEARAGWRGGEVEAKWLDVVRYRPDLAVQMVDAPGVTPVNTMVQVNATVVERMDEVGAHADCVLLVDGTQVDAAPGIWVDAGGSATCRFTTSFQSGGLHTITVKAQNVKPGDYDDSNNAFSRQIQVQNSASATMYYDMAVMDQTQTSTTTTDKYYTSTSAPPEEHKVETSNNYTQTRQLYGTIPAAIGDVKRIVFSDSSAGKSLSSVTVMLPAFTAVTPVDTSLCDPATTNESMLNDFDMTAGRAVTVIRCFNANTNQGTTIVSVAFSASDNTYYSSNTCKSLALGCVPGDFTTGTPDGTRVLLGDDYAADFTLEDGSVYNAQPKLSLPVVSGSTTPVTTSSCGAQDFGTGTLGKVCIETVTTDYVRQGDSSTLPASN
jgi:hypothetical protein